MKENDFTRRLRAIRELNNRAAWAIVDWMDSGGDITSLPEDPQIKEYFSHGIRRLDKAVYEENPYYKSIRFPEESLGEWSLTRREYAPGEAFIRDEIVLTEDFHEYPQIGYFDSSFRYPVVLQDGREWMAIKPNEIQTMAPAITKARGDVLTFGLGLGYFAYMASLKSDVRTVTIVEKAPEVISLFQERILPQFAFKEKIRITRDDALTYSPGPDAPPRGFDFVFVDLWHDTDDGLPMYLKMKRRQKDFPQAEFAYWVERSILSALRWQVFDRIIASSRSEEEILLKLSDDFLRNLAGR